MIENLNLDVTGDQPAIPITSDDVTIRNVHTATTTGDGIDVFGHNATISNVEVDAPAATDNGGMDGEGSDGVYAYDVSGLKVDHATFRNTGSGVATNQAPGTVLSNIEGHDMQGPFPGGQLVQFGESDGSSLTNFYVDNDPKISHPEDDISVYNSRNVTVSQGVLDGDNSPSGVGVMVEGTSDGTEIRDVDAIHMGDGAFSSYSNGVSFTNVRSFDNIATDQGRGTPLSGGLIFYAPGSDVSFDGATYTDPGQPGNIVSGDPVEADITEDKAATPMAHISNGSPSTATAPVAPASSVASTAPVTPAVPAAATSTTAPPIPVAPAVTASASPAASATPALPVSSAEPVTVAPAAAAGTPADTTATTAPAQGATAISKDDGNAGGSFVFDPSYGQGVVQNLIAAAQPHDIGHSSSDDFKSIVDVLRSLHDAGGSSTITDPTSGDAIRLANISKGDSEGHHGGFAFHH